MSITAVLVFVCWLTAAWSVPVCEVSQDTKLGEGLNILSGEACSLYCNLVPACLHWTWYSRHCASG